MADVAIVGGGIIGAACAYELARAGASVTLIERDELAAGASGRNAGLWAAPTDPALRAMAEVSLSSYLALGASAPVSFELDRRPIGTVLVPLDGDEARAVESVEAYRRAGVVVEELDADRLRVSEPALDDAIERGWLVYDAHRLDPAALTVSLALMAKQLGARVLHHVKARSLIVDGDEIRGVVTDDGPMPSDMVVAAAGPWTMGLLEPVGIRIPLTAVRGWLVRLDARPDLLHHIVAECGWRESLERTNAIDAITASELAGGQREGAIGLMVAPYPRGGVLVGTSRQTAVTPEPEDPSVPLRLARNSIRLVPELADARVLGSWWGLRPMTPDERPLVGRVRDGLIVATGHGSEGVILGAGTAQLVASIVGGEEPPFDPTPFDPLRFG